MYAFLLHLLAGLLTFVALPYFLWLSRWAISRIRPGNSILGMLLGIVLSFAASVGAVVLACKGIGVPMSEAWALGGVPVAYVLGLVFLGYPLSGWILGYLGRHGWLPDFEVGEGGRLPRPLDGKVLVEPEHKQAS